MEQAGWESRRFSELSKFEGSFQNCPLPRSATGEAISRRTTYFGCGIFVIGCAYLLIEHDRSFGSWAVVSVLAIAAAVFLDNHLRKKDESIINEELKTSRAKLEKDHEGKS
jgi:hypothetical protein